MCKCRKCGSKMITLTDSEDRGFLGRVANIVTSMFLASLFISFLGGIGVILAMVSLAVGLVRACFSQVIKTYHCDICGAITKIEGGKL